MTVILGVMRFTNVSASGKTIGIVHGYQLMRSVFFAPHLQVFIDLRVV